MAEESRFLQPGEVLSAPHISSILWSRRAASELRFETWRNENEKLRITAEKEEEEVKEKEVAMRALEVEKENAAVAVPISQDLSTPVAKQIANAFIPFIATREGTNESKMALFDSTVTEIVEFALVWQTCAKTGPTPVSRTIQTISMCFSSLEST